MQKRTVKSSLSVWSLKHPRLNSSPRNPVFRELESNFVWHVVLVRSFQQMNKMKPHFEELLRVRSSKCSGLSSSMNSCTLLFQVMQFSFSPLVSFGLFFLLYDLELPEQRQATGRQKRRKPSVICTAIVAESPALDMKRQDTTYVLRFALPQNKARTWT